MRTLLPLAAVCLIGCSNNADDPDTGPTWVTDTNTTTPEGSGGSGSTTSSQGGSGSGGSGTTQTVATHIGDATLDVDQGTWTGTESVRLLTVSAGDLVCQWTWAVNEVTQSTTLTSPTTSTGGTTGQTTAPAPGNWASTALPCTDGDGNDCAFSFDVSLQSGAQTQGNCSSFNIPADGGLFHYGYLDEYFSGGVSYGSMFVYYLPPSGTTGDPVWFPVERYGVGAHTWDDTTGALTYEIPHTLLGPITP